jgi:exonuclease SbcC
LIKPQLKIAQQVEQELTNTANQLNQAKDKLQQLQSTLQPKQQTLQSLQQQSRALDMQQQQQQQTLAGNIAFSVFDAEPQAALHTLQKAATLRHKLSSQQPELLLQPSRVQQQHIQAIHNQIDTLVNQHGSLMQLEQQVHQLQQQLEIQKNHSHKCELVKQKIQRWAHTEQQLEQISQQQISTQQQFAQVQLALQQAEQQRLNAELQLKTTQKLLTEQRLFTAQSVKELRQQLKPDQPCMVCGSTEHPFYQSEQLLHALNQQLDAQQEQAEQAVQQALKHERDLHQSTTQQLTRLDQLLIRHDQLQQERQDILQDIATLSSKFYQRLLPQPELAMAQQTLQTIQEKLTHTAQSLEQQIQQQHSQLKTWQQLEKQLEQQQNLLDKYHELTALELKVVTTLDTTLQQAWQQDCVAAHTRFAQQIQQRCDALAQLKQIETQRQQLQQQSIPLQADINHLTAQQHELQQQIDQHTSQQQQRQQQLDQLFGEHAAPWVVTSCQQWIEQLDQQLQQQLSQLQQADQLRQHTEKQHTRLQQQHEYIAAEIQKNQQQRLQQHTVIEQWKQQHSQFSDAHIIELLTIDYAHKQQLQAEFQRLQQHLHQAENSLNIYQNQLSQHAVNQPATRSELLQQSLQDTRQQLKQLDEQCTHLKLKKLQDEQQQQQAVQYQVALNKAKAEHHRWSKISSLIGDAKGVTFKKLAQQFHLQMLVELANQQLSALTPRYALRCIEDSLGLTIVDHYMNDEVRPVVSLSGGESFLVSLALALGIANMASGTTKLESLFIDEGFGTLDQSSLHVVMDALDRLQSQGRKVILISHIQEMHERIPVKIQVLPQGSGASRIEVVG